MNSLVLCLDLKVATVGAFFKAFQSCELLKAELQS